MTPKLSDEEVKKRKTRIIKAALACFSRKGYHRTTMDDIVAESGLSKGGVYWHFKSKKELFMAAFTEALGGSPEDMAIPILESPGSAADKLHMVLQLFTQMSTDSLTQEMAPLLLEVLIQNIREGEVREVAAQSLYRYRDPLARMIGAGIEAGEFAPVDPETLASILIATYDGLMLQWLSDPSLIDWDTVQQTLEKTLVAGLTKK